MIEGNNALLSFSNATTTLVERAAASIVAVHAGGRWSSSGIHWRPGVIVTAEEALERDENIKLTLPGGRQVEASLAGRDPSTDVAVLRFQADGLAVSSSTDAAPRVGNLVVAVGSREGAPLAALGMVAFSGGAWQSARGGMIDSLIRLDLQLNPAAEGGALLDVHGQVIGMAVLGPRRRALAIPNSTIDRAADQLLTRGHAFRGYLGARLQQLRTRRRSAAQSPVNGRGLLVVSIDPNGPSARAGLLVGDIVAAWNGEPIDRVREIMRRLRPDAIGNTVDLTLTRAGAPTTLKVVIGERPIT